MQVVIANNEDGVALFYCVRNLLPNRLRKGGQMSGLEICLEATGDGSHSSISRVTVIGVENLAPTSRVCAAAAHLTDDLSAPIGNSQTVNHQHFIPWEYALQCTLRFQTTRSRGIGIAAVAINFPCPPRTGLLVF